MSHARFVAVMGRWGDVLFQKTGLKKIVFRVTLLLVYMVYVCSSDQSESLETFSEFQI